MQTDFPEPVVPAISKCGIEVRSPIIGMPEILFPSAMGNEPRLIGSILTAYQRLKTLPIGRGSQSTPSHGLVKI